MEIILGREEGARRLHCIADGRDFYVGLAGCVPASVSRKHCKIVINGTHISVENLKVQNITFVDDSQIISKEITATSKVQLGKEKYTIPLQQIIQLATGKPTTNGDSILQSNADTPMFSLKPLERVWEEYANRKIEIQEAETKSANMSRLQGILSMCGMCIGFIPGIDLTFRIIIIAVALLIAIYLFLRSMSKDIVQKQLNDLDEEYAGKYKCPNPACGKPFGGVPYRQIKYNKQCFACGCKYTH